jgi:hypothetical protein
MPDAPTCSECVDQLQYHEGPRIFPSCGYSRRAGGGRLL